MQKKEIVDAIRKIIKFEALPKEVKKAFEEEYPDGYKNLLFKVDAPKGVFYAFTFEHQNVKYLVKVDVNLNSMFEDDDDDDDDNIDDDNDDGFMSAIDDIEDVAE